MTHVFGMLAAIALTAICWGVYGPVLHFGRDAMQSALRPFVCVGLAYFLIGVISPVALLWRGGEKGSWTSTGVLWSMLAGVAGSLGALGVILALTAGGNPIYIMPLVFGGAPVVNTLMSAYLNKSFYQLKAPFLAGLILVITGAVTVLIFKPQVHATPNPPSVAAAVEAGAGDSGGVEKKAEHFVEILLAVCLALLSWGVYGPVLHKGQAAMGGSRFRPLICIGIAYFLIAVLVPLALLQPLQDKGSWNLVGIAWSTAAGSLGAIGALGTILAFACGGKPFTVMPVVFGCAPVINTLTTLSLSHTPTSALSPFFLAGILIVGVGAATVLTFGPRGQPPPKTA